MRKLFGRALNRKFWLNFNKDIFADKIWVLFLQADKAMRILNVTFVSLFRDGWSHFTQGEWSGCTAMCHFLLSCGYVCCSRNLPLNIRSNRNPAIAVWTSPKKQSRILDTHAPHTTTTSPTCYLGDVFPGANTWCLGDRVIPVYTLITSDTGKQTNLLPVPWLTIFVNSWYL